MYILGISAFYHDSAAVLIKNGEIIAAVEEERFSRIKHDNAFPFQAIERCLQLGNISIEAIDFVAYYEKPLLKFERILQAFVETYPFAIAPFLKAIPEWLSEKITVESIIRKKLHFKKKIYYIPHHLSHAAAGYFTSPYSSAAIVTIDGVGEYQTTCIWKAKSEILNQVQDDIVLLKSLDFPHSLGLLYSTFTAFLGFRVNEDEYKVMGLAAYGKPTYVKKIEKLIDIKDDGSFRLNMEYFSFRERFQMWNKKFERLFGEPRRSFASLRMTELTQKHKDIAASIQYVTEQIYFKILNHAYEIAYSKNQDSGQARMTALCISGGVGLNALANGKIYANTPFHNVHIFGPAGDSGNAIGAALFTYYHILEQKTPKKAILSLSWGTSYDNSEIELLLQKEGLKYQHFTNENELIKTTAKLLAGNNLIGWFQGSMEFGPRALGNRSILANPKPASMKEKMNRIKKRELYRPFACSILKEKVHEYFEIPTKSAHFPYMNFCFIVKKGERNSLQAVVHKDNTCRIQTVTNSTNSRYYKLITAFEKLTGIPALMNTSFNLNHEPIVETPLQALEDFKKTTMDYLVLGNFVIKKNT